MSPFQPEDINLTRGREFSPVLKGLKALILVLPVFLIVLLVNRALVGDWVVVWILTAIIFISLYASRHLKKGRVGKVTLFLSVFFISAITVVCTLGGGIHDIVIVMYPLVLGFSSILLKIKEVIITSVLSFLSVGWLVLNEICGFFPPASIESGLISDFASVGTMVLMGALLTYLIIRNIKESMLQANNERDKKILAVQDLNSELDEKNQLINEIHEKVSKSLSYIELLTDLSQSEESDNTEYKNLRRKMISIQTANDILDESSAFQQIDLQDLIPQLLSRYRKLYDEQEISFETKLSKALVSRDEAVSIGFCLLELIYKELVTAQGFKISVGEIEGEVRLTLSFLAATSNAEVDAPDPGSVLINMMVRQLDGQLERTDNGGDTSVVFMFKPKERKQ